MADPVYKRVTDLDAATLPLATGDEIPVSQSGATKKATFGGIFGSGWFAKLFAPLASFVAPEATHAIDCDTIEGETPANLHDAAQLTGAINLARIPAELTGKNAATANTAAALSGCGYFGAGGTLPSGGTFLVIRFGVDSNIVGSPQIATQITIQNGGVVLAATSGSYIFSYVYFRITN